MGQLKFIRPKLESVFVGMVVFAIIDKETPLQVAEIIDDHLSVIFKLVDINSGDEIIVYNSQFVVLSMEADDKCYPIKYSRLGNALKLLNQQIQNVHFKLIPIENGLLVAKV